MGYIYVPNTGIQGQFGGGHEFRAGKSTARLPYNHVIGKGLLERGRGESGVSQGCAVQVRGELPVYLELLHGTDNDTQLAVRNA